MHAVTLTHVFILTLVFCAMPDRPAFGSYDMLYYYKLFPGEHVTFTCDDDYRLRGSETVVCRDDGTWNASVPTCEQSKSNFDLNY